jgi:tartrate/fumarate subfamily iron-sulfur-dependent hydro-lyase alpha chain
MMDLKKQIVGLYRKAATELPKDISIALENAYAGEDNALGRAMLAKMLQNIKLAGNEKKPLCQDTGIPFFYVRYPSSYTQKELSAMIQDATDIATEEVPLRPNAVDCINGANIGNRPVIHFEEADELEIDLLLKGGGSENVSAIYQLPNSSLNAHRDLDGVRKCILDAVFKAQGKGCPPYIIGCAIGGSIEEVAHNAKKQLLWNIGSINDDKQLAELEKQTLEQINQLGIGPLGLGGKTTALAVHIDSGVRHPASFFVGVSVGCWCLRRASL